MSKEKKKRESWIMKKLAKHLAPYIARIFRDESLFLEIRPKGEANDWLWYGFGSITGVQTHTQEQYDELVNSLWHHKDKLSKMAYADEKREMAIKKSAATKLSEEEAKVLDVCHFQREEEESND